MSTTRPTKEPWDDERLAAAYRAGFGMTTPKDVEDRVERALSEATVPSRGRWGASLRLSGLGAIASLAIVVAAVLISNGLPGRLPSSSGATASVLPATVGSPTPPAFPDRIFGVAVHSVAEAIVIRDRGDGSEIAVAGWYQMPIPIRCPSRPSLAPPLDGGCEIGFQWLMAAPESLIHSDANNTSMAAPTGLAVNAVFDGVETTWSTRVSYVGPSTPNAVLFVGHFNDARAPDCAVKDLDACRQRFVVDQVPWVDGATQDAAFPAAIEGIPVWSVEETLERRDAGDARGVAIAIGAWYSESITFGPACLPPPVHWGSLEQYCNHDRNILADLRQSVTSDQSRGTSLGPIFSPDWGSSFLSDGQFPQRIVLVGHFDDPLATDCPHLGPAVCRAIFVVDQLAWSSGKVQEPRIGSARGPSRSDQGGAAVVTSAIGPGAVVLSITAMEARDVATLDPTALVDHGSTNGVWYIRAIEAKTHRIGSFVVDQASLAILWSAFPMPTIEAP